MVANIFMILAAALVLYFCFLMVGALRVYAKLRGPLVLTCPETNESVLVEVAAGDAALQALLDEPCLRVQSCSRWPMRRDCGQDCLRQVEGRPSELRFCQACKGS